MSKGWWWFLGALVTFVVLSFAFAENGGDSNDYEPSAADAIRMCRESIDAKLRAPGTASFGGIETTGSGDVYEVTGWVDAENAFGGEVRVGWMCDAVHDGGGAWRTRSALDD